MTGFGGAGIGMAVMGLRSATRTIGLERRARLLSGARGRNNNGLSKRLLLLDPSGTGTERIRSNGRGEMLDPGARREDGGRPLGSQTRKRR
jgi:hypothetical protein